MMMFSVVGPKSNLSNNYRIHCISPKTLMTIMELVLELFLTLFVAVVCSFLVAKLISFASAGDGEQVSRKDLDVGEFVEREFAFEEECRLNSEGVGDEMIRRCEKGGCVNRVESLISRDLIVQEQVLEAAAVTDVEFLVESLEKFNEIEFGSQEFKVETDVEVDAKGLCGLMLEEDVDGTDFVEFDETAKEDVSSLVSAQFDESGALEEVEVVTYLVEEDNILENARANDQIGKEKEVVDTCYKEATEVKNDREATEVKSIQEATEVKSIQEATDVKSIQEASEVKSIQEATEVKSIQEATEVKSDQNHGSETSEKELYQEDDRKQEWIDGNEDDWEGIEQSKLQKVFDQASKFVTRMGEDIWGNDLHMQLYGLHKVALEGPCQEPQPMALKLTARSKWNAWQRLGNMSPDVAMEHYINLVSDKYPQWMEDNPSGDIIKNTQEAGAPGSQDYIEDKPYEGNPVEMETKLSSA